MKKQLINRGLLGFPLGIAIGFVITVMISMTKGDGVFYPVTPELIETMGNELNAVILQKIALSFSRSYLTNNGRPPGPASIPEPLFSQ